MTKTIDHVILNITGAAGIGSIETIQELWSGYGKIIRVNLKGCEYKSIIVKHIHLPEDESHPRGWNTDISRERKLFSYKVEAYWYENISNRCDNNCYVPRFLGIEKIGDEVILILEDLNEAGFPHQKASIDWKGVKAGLKWLAHFHGTFLEEKSRGMWKTGTYWHLDTRPDELEALRDKDLKKAAPVLDKKLNEAKYQTLVHGDAKLANFCFSPEGNKIAAVDFQYIGGGCGMKDVAYFVGSCLAESSCEEMESEILNYYFAELRLSLENKKSHINFRGLESEWRSLYYLAWTDFFRFLKGWSPGHWKINSYSEKISRLVINSLKKTGEL